MLEAILVLGGLGLFSGLGLGIAAKKFAVEIDPRIAQLEAALPGANCGACGYAGCRGYAEAVAEGAETNLCRAGGDTTAHAVARIMGVEAKAVPKIKARILCQGNRDIAQIKYRYLGIQDCQAGNMLAGGDKACPYGCIGLGSCAKVCPVDAITINPGGLAAVDEAKCIGCGKCVQVCPRKVMQFVEPGQPVTVLCHSADLGKTVRTYCQAGCIACQMCKKVCPADAVIFEQNLARIDAAKCIVCGKCVEKCPTKCIAMAGRPAQPQPEPASQPAHA